jgi:hypothetical protein
MILAALFKTSDIIAAPLCFTILLMIFSVIIKKYKDDDFRKLLLKAFYFKMAFALIYTLLNTFYYRSGDSDMYYQATKALNRAVLDDSDNFMKIYLTKMINVKTDLVAYFIYLETQYPIFEAMHDPGNFMVPKLGLPFSLIFNQSYLCIGMGFSFFALGGAIRMYKFLTYYFPVYKKEIALATLFLPSVAIWSSGLIKDPICFGAVGYLLYGVFNVVIRKKNIIWSLAWITLSIFLLYFIKVYILLAISPAIILWLFVIFNKRVTNVVLRRILNVITFSAGVLVAFLLLNYATSDESLRAYSFDNISETSAESRALYEDFGEKYEGSYYSIRTTNPILIFLNGIGATFFRPFIWEVNSITALLSALESLFFLYITLTLIYRRGLVNFFRKIFADPVLMLCFIFSIVFAAAVGSTALNFGSLSRYKIPCLPFYLSMVLILYRQEKLAYPRWFNKLLGYRVSNRLRKTAF